MCTYVYVLYVDATVRLVGGGNATSGRVEILHDGVWGTVCDDGWSTTDGQVVCHQLGYPSIISAPCCAHNGRGSGQIWLDDVRCDGDEEDLADCDHRGWGDHNCGHSEDASVNCLGEYFITNEHTMKDIVSWPSVLSCRSCEIGWWT